MAQAVFREEVEQQVLGAYLPAKGFFVEVGAFHPVDFSQTFLLEQRGWDGILVEPIPAQAENLRRMRRARVFEVACGSPAQHGRTNKMSVAGALSSLRADESGAGQSVDVPIRTLDSLLAEANAPRIDLLSVDVEGVELDVLAGFSFDTYRPGLILLEDFAERLDKHRFMRAHGYKRVRRTGNNSWYVPDDMPFPLSAFERWQLLRKYYLALPTRWLKNNVVLPLKQAMGR
jgi:FkbM family methyltransferase